MRLELGRIRGANFPPAKHFPLLSRLEENSTRRGPDWDLRLQRETRRCLRQASTGVVLGVFYEAAVEREDLALVVLLADLVLQTFSADEALRLLLFASSCEHQYSEALAFVERLMKIPSSGSRCGQVWEGEHVAYRCVTCGGSQSSCICVQCFRVSSRP